MSLRDDLESVFLTGGDVRDASSETSIDWSALGLGVVGSIILSVVVGVSETILSVGEWISTTLLGVGSYVVCLGESAGGIVATGSSTAATSWSSFVGVLGPAALPLSVAAAFGMLVAIAVVVNRGR
jgi:hypothetical protein